MKSPCVYILTNTSHSTLYIGVTSNIYNRLNQHLSMAVDCFTKKYKLTKLVHLETFDSMMDAIEREKQLKNWHRPWKEQLIIKSNPFWKDLSKEL